MLVITVSCREGVQVLFISSYLNPYAADGYFGQQKMMQKTFKILSKPCQMGTHLRVLLESFPMNTNVTGFRCFSKIFAPCGLDESSLSIGRVKKDYFSYFCQ